MTAELRALRWCLLPARDFCREARLQKGKWETLLAEARKGCCLTSVSYPGTWNLFSLSPDRTGRQRSLEKGWAKEELWGKFRKLGSSGEEGRAHWVLQWKSLLLRPVEFTGQC